MHDSGQFHLVPIGLNLGALQAILATQVRQMSQVRRHGTAKVVCSDKMNFWYAFGRDFPLLPWEAEGRTLA